MELPGTRAEMTCIPLHKTWADEPTLADGQYQSKDDLHSTTQNLAEELTLAMNCHHFRDDLHTTTQNLADEPTLAEQNMFESLESGFLSFLQLQKSLLVNRVIKNRCLEYCYTKLGR